MPGTGRRCGWTRGLLSPSALRLAPRTGFALSLADNRAVIRGGYGVFLNQWAYSVQRRLAYSVAYTLSSSLNGVFFAQSGAPFTVNLGVDRANIGAGPAQRPNRVSDPNLPGGERRADRWFDTAAFALPAPFTFGTAPRNSVLGPGYASLDLPDKKFRNSSDAAMNHGH